MPLQLKAPPPPKKKYPSKNRCNLKRVLPGQTKLVCRNILWFIAHPEIQNQDYAYKIPNLKAASRKSFTSRALCKIISLYLVLLICKRLRMNISQLHLVLFIAKIST